MVGATPALAEASAAAGMASPGLGTAALLPKLPATGSLFQVQLSLERLRLPSLFSGRSFGLAPSKPFLVLGETRSYEALLPVVCHL